MASPVPDLSALIALLNGAVQGPAGGRFITLDAALLTAAGDLATILQSPGGAITVTENGTDKLIEPDAAAGLVKIVGTADLFAPKGKAVGYAAAITARVPQADDVTLDLAATPSDAGAWTFAANFAPLPDFMGPEAGKTGLFAQASFFNDAALSSPAFAAATYKGGPNPEGLSFTATLDPTKGALGARIGKYLTKPIALSGSIAQRANDWPLIVLNGLTGHTVPQVGAAELRLGTKGAGKTGASTADLAAVAAIKGFPGFSIAGSVLEGDETWVLTAALENPEQYTLANGLSALVDFVGGTPLSLPEGIDALASMYLSSVTVGLTPQKGGAPKIDMLGLSIGYAKDWPIPLPGGRISDVAVDWMVANPGASAFLFGEIRGNLVIGEGSADLITLAVRADISGAVGATLPSVMISADLAQPDGKPASIDRVVQHFAGFDPALGVDLDALSMEIDTGERTLLFYGAIGVKLPVNAPLIAVTNASFGVHVTPNRVTGSLGVGFKIGSLPLVASAEYRGKDAGWLLSGGMAPGAMAQGGVPPGRKAPAAKPVLLGDWLKSVDNARFADVPAAIGNISLRGLQLSYDTRIERFDFDTVVGWTYTLDSYTWDLEAEFQLTAISKPAPTLYTGKLRGRIMVGPLAVSVIYSFDTGDKTKDGTVTFQIAYKGATLTAVLSKNKKLERILTVRLGNVSFGDILGFLVGLVEGGADFRLPAPWDALYDVSFDGLSLEINLTTRAIGIDYRVNLDLGLAKLDTIALTYADKAGTRSVDIAITGRFVDQTYTKDDPLSWDLLNDPAPTPPGKGTQLLDLRFLAMGHNVAFRDTKDFETVLQVITALEDDFKPLEDGDETPMAGLPALRFSSAGNWLIGADFTIMETVSLAGIFNDPALYGIRLALAGKKSGALAGLAFEILYKKVTDDIGVYIIHLKLPDAMRQIQLGSVSITLPNVGIEIYTNGNFRIDVGFPKGGDFSGSFSLQVFPFVGFGGFYFAVLDGQTSDTVPKISNGEFSPVLEFGLGLSVGVGKTINEGILKAGLTLTVEGILEGTLAWFNPNDASVPADRFLRVRGSVAIVGKLYGEINFVVIQVRVSVTASATATLTIQSYEPTLLELVLKVEAEASIKILFVKVHFSFEMELKLNFEIGEKGTSPWIVAPTEHPAQARQLHAQTDRAPVRRMTAARLMAAMRAETGERATIDFAHRGFAGAGARIPLDIVVMPAVTVAEGAQVHAQQAPGAALQVVVPLFMPNGIPHDAADAKGVAASDAGAEDAAFNRLVGAVFDWAVASIDTDAHSPVFGAAGSGEVTVAHLEELSDYLQDPANRRAAFSYANVTGFLSRNFELRLSSPLGPSGPAGYEAALSGATGGASTSIFPMIPALKMAPDGRPQIDFAAHNPVSAEYLANLEAYFNELTSNPTRDVAKDPDAPDAATGATAGAPSMATAIFESYFAMLAAGAVREAAALMKAYPYSVTGADSLNSISAAFGGQVFEYAARAGDTIDRLAGAFGIAHGALRRANPWMAALEGGEALAPGAPVNLPVGVGPESIAAANAAYPLARGATLGIEGVRAQIAAGDSLEGVAKRFGLNGPAPIFDWQPPARMSQSGPAGMTALRPPNPNASDPNLLRPDAAIWIAPGAGMTGATFGPTFARRIDAGDLLGPTAGVAGRVAAFYTARTQPAINWPFSAWYGQRLVDLNPGIDWSAPLAGATVAAPVAGLTGGALVQSGTTAYQIRPGDTADLMAAYLALEQIGADVPEMAEAAAFFDAMRAQVRPQSGLQPGQSVSVPGFRHAVRSGETLDTLHARFGEGAVGDALAPPALAWANRASTELLQPRGVLAMPPLIRRIGLTGPAETLASVAADYNLTLDALADAAAGATGIFTPTGATGAQMVVPDVALRKVADLRRDMIAQGNANRIAAMVSRFLMHGLRVAQPAGPVGAGGAVDAWPPGVDLWGLFEMIGQQIPAPASLTAGYGVDLTKDPAADWISFAARPAGPTGAGGPTGGLPSLGLDLSPAYFAQSAPSPTFAPQILRGPSASPLYDETPRRYGLQKMLHWQSAKPPALPGMTGPNAPIAGEPTIWPFPDALNAAVAGALDGRGATAGTRPYTLIATPPGGAGGARALTGYEWASAVPIRVRREAAAGAPMQNAYLVLGADEAGRDTLLKAWSALEAGPSAGARIDVLFAPDPTGGNALGLASGVVNAADTCILKTNLSTVTHSGVQRMMLAAMGGALDHVATLDAPGRFLRMAWEASITASGGFYLHYAQAGGAGLPETLFTNGDEAEIWLLLTTGAGRALRAFDNCAVVGENIASAGLDLHAQLSPDAARPEDLVRIANVPPGSVAFELERTDPTPGLVGASGPLSPAQQADLTRSLYSLLGWQVAGNAWFGASNEATPLGPLPPGPSGPSGAWVYRHTAPVSVVGSANDMPASAALPPAADNPYRGISGPQGPSGPASAARLNFRFQDLYGNRTEATAPPAPLDLTVGYTDPVIGVDGWPGAAFDYAFRPGAGGPELHAALSLQIDGYVAGAGLPQAQAAQNAAGDAARWRQIVYQVQQRDLGFALGSNLGDAALCGDRLKAPMAAFAISAWTFADAAAKLSAVHDLAGASETFGAFAAAHAVHAPALAEANGTAMARDVFAGEVSMPVIVGAPPMNTLRRLVKDHDGSGVGVKTPPLGGGLVGEVQAAPAARPNRVRGLQARGRDGAEDAMLAAAPQIAAFFAGSGLSVETLAANNAGKPLSPGLVLRTAARTTKLTKAQSPAQLAAALRCPVLAEVRNPAFPGPGASPNLQVGLLVDNYAVPGLLTGGITLSMTVQEHTETVQTGATLKAAFDALQAAFAKASVQITLGDFARAVAAVPGLIADQATVTHSAFAVPEPAQGARPSFSLGDLPAGVGTLDDLAKGNAAAQGFFAPSTPIFIRDGKITPGKADTLAALAQETRVSLGQWAAFNTKTALKPGAKLAIPMLAAWKAEDLSAIYTGHRPTAADSLDALAKLYGLSARDLASLNRAIPGIFADGASVLGATATARDSMDGIWRGMTGAYPQFGDFVDALAPAKGIYRPDGVITAPAPRMPGPAPDLTTLAKGFNLTAEAPQTPALRLAAANRALHGFLLVGATIAPPKGTSGLAPETVGKWDTLDTVLGRFAAQLAAQHPQAPAPGLADLVAANQQTGGLFTPGKPFLTPPSPTRLQSPFTPVIPPRGASGPQARFVFPAQVEMTLARDPGLISPDLRGAAPVARATSAIVARGAAAAGGAMKLDAFAEDFEAAFKAERLKCAVSKRHGLAADPTARAHVWAVNFGPQGVGQVAVDADAPQFYALRPLSTAPLAGTVTVRDYTPGQGLGATASKRFDEVDLDAWMRQLLSAVDLYLTPQYAAPSIELAGATAMQGAIPAAPGPVGYAAGPVGLAAAAAPPGPLTGAAGARDFDAIVAAKGQIAKALRAEVSPVLDVAGATAGVYAESAREALYQQMLVRLSAAYAVDAVVQYPVGLTSGFSPTGPALPPRLSGKVAPDLPRTPQGAPTINALAKEAHVSAPFLAQIMGDAQGVLRNGAVVQYPAQTGKTLPVGPTATLNGLARDFNVPTGPTAPGYWAGWSTFVDGIGAQKLLTPGAEAPITRIARSVGPGDSLALMASFAGIDVGSLAEANETAPGIFAPGWTVTLGAGSYATTGSETLQDVAAALPPATVRTLAEQAEAAKGAAKTPLRTAAILAPGGALHAAQLLPDVTLSTSKVSLAKEGGLAPPLTFFVETAHESRFRKLFLNLRYVINELEFDVTDVAAAGDYKASSWLTFILPIGSGRGADVGIKTAMAQVQAPLPLRNYPSPPLLTGQSAAPSAPDATTIPDARLWDYRFDFNTRSADQDTDHLEVSFNRRRAGDAAQPTTARNDALFKALARFMAVYPALKTDLARLPALRGGAQDAAAAAAVAALRELVAGVASALHAPAPLALSAELPEETRAWRLTTAVDATGRDLRDLTMTPEAPLGATGATGPVLWPDGVFVQSPAGPTAGPDAGFVQLAGKDGFYTYPPGIAAGAPITQRVLFRRRDVIADRNAWSGVYVARNEDLIAHGPLGPRGMTQAIATRPDFVYRTPVVRFVDPLTPFVTNRSPLDVTGLTGPSGPPGTRKLTDHLTNMLDAVLAARPWAGLRSEIRLQLKVSYAFGLTPGAGTALYATTPILLMPTRAVDGAALAALVAELAAAINAWHAAHAPSGAAGRLTFEAGVFEGGAPAGATGAAQKPILRLDDLVLPVDQVDWS